MTIGAGEIPCAFAYDEQLGKWSFVLPESTGGSTMTVKANYRRVWKWGKMVLDQVPEEYLFYLMARGLSRTNAERMVVQGFFEEVLNRIPVEGVRNKLETEIARKLGL